MGKLIDLTGQKFGRLTVLKRGENSINSCGLSNVKWTCQCECGKIIDVLSICLRKGYTKSCGCYNIEKISERKFIDLSGQKFDNLTVLKRGEDLITEKRHYVRWVCQCSCGNTILSTTRQLKDGIKRSCGCTKKPRIDKEYAEKLYGQKFGRLTIVNLAERKKGKLYFNCKCECGKELAVNAYSLANGLIQSCGCLTKEISSKIFLDNLIGNRYGKLLVVKRADNYIAPSNKKPSPQWLCKCDCGNETVVTSKNLKNGSTKSCGCIHYELISEKLTKDITGQRFGKLTVIRRIENKYKKVHWLCKCDCGNEISVSSGSLISGKTTSCGCIISFGEYQIKQYLIRQNIVFKSQKKFIDLVGIHNGQLSYDFYIPQFNLLIEAQGQQHESPVDYFGGKEQFEIQQEHDKRKREYAESHGYKYLDIWYYDYDNVEKILSEYIQNISQHDCEGKNLSC